MYRIHWIEGSRRYELSEDVSATRSIFLSRHKTRPEAEAEKRRYIAADKKREKATCK